VASVNVGNICESEKIVNRQGGRSEELACLLLFDQEMQDTSIHPVKRLLADSAYD